MNSISFSGREGMLIDAAGLAAKTAENRAVELAKAAARKNALENNVIKASSVLGDMPQGIRYPYISDDAPVAVGKIINHLA